MFGRKIPVVIDQNDSVVFGRKPAKKFTATINDIETTYLLQKYLATDGKIFAIGIDVDGNAVAFRLNEIKFDMEDITIGEICRS